jgi:hypothetical protein
LPELLLDPLLVWDTIHHINKAIRTITTSEKKMVFQEYLLKSIAILVGRGSL